MICPRCGKEVEKVCASCWRCADCVLDCRTHMRRSINGYMEGSKKSKK